MSPLNKFMCRGFVPPQVHGVLDYPLAAILIAGPLLLDLDYKAATIIVLVFGGGAAVLAVATAWSTGIFKIIRAHLLPCCRGSRSARDACNALRVAGPVVAHNDVPPGRLARAQARSRKPSVAALIMGPRP